MSLNANALTTVAAVQAVTGMSGITTPVAERLINAASAFLEGPRGIARKLYQDSAIVVKVAGYGDPYLRVSQTPINSVTSITYDGSTVDVSDYEIDDAGEGLIYLSGGATWTAPRASGLISNLPLAGMERRLYTITYDGGWITPAQGGSATLPADIEEACLQLVVSGYRKDGQDQAIASERIMSTSVTYRPDSVPQFVTDVTGSYRRRSLS
jgi:hypothetical protein